MNYGNKNRAALRYSEAFKMGNFERNNEQVFDRDVR